MSIRLMTEDSLVNVVQVRDIKPDSILVFGRNMFNRPTEIEEVVREIDRLCLRRGVDIKDNKIFICNPAGMKNLWCITEEELNAAGYFKKEDL